MKAVCEIQKGLTCAISQALFLLKTFEIVQEIHVSLNFPFKF